MNIIVIMKQTFGTEEKIVLKDGQVSDDNVEFVINPYDEFAVEEAIRQKETHGGEVTVVTVGLPRAEQALRTALAMGADKAVLIDGTDVPADEFVVSNILHAYLSKRPFDLILGGNLSVDNGAGQVAVRLAELLDIPQLTTITKLDISGGIAHAERNVEGDVESVECPLPLLATAQQGLNEPRYPSLPGIMKAKKKPLERVTVQELGLDQEALAPKTNITERQLPPKKQAGKVLMGEIADQAKELARLLSEEAKVI